MKYTYFKITTLVVLFAFLSMTISPYYSHAKGRDINEKLEEGKLHYKYGEYDAAIKSFCDYISFIEKNKKTEKYKSQLCEAYYYKARIFFSVKMVSQMKESLQNLFEINPDYNYFPVGEDQDFKNESLIIQRLVKANIQKKNAQKAENPPPPIHKEKDSPKIKNKKFPLLLVAVSAVVVGVIIYFLVIKKAKQTLTVTVGDGVAGGPAGGTYTYKKGAVVSYNYSLQPTYSSLSVKLDGAEVAPSGTFKMDKNHTLTASASRTYSLTVVKGMGVNGTPESGTFSYNNGDSVQYNYTPQSGYTGLIVNLDGGTVNASGTIVMNADHTLTVTAGKACTLTVTKGEGVIGLPESGIYSYLEGSSAEYSYSLQSGYKDLLVKLDGTPVSAIGYITMNANHTLDVSAVKVGYYTLTVDKRTGVSGSPNSGSNSYKEGTTVSYNYALQDGYKDLVVTLDGTAVEANGTITMNKNHSLIASATQIGYYTLNVTKGAGVNGTPEKGVSTYKEGTSIGYSYTLQDGYGNLVVKLDGKTVSASGTIPMNANHTLTAAASKKYTLTVTRGTGVNGTPSTGTYEYTDGASLSYSYTLQNGYKFLDVTLDGNSVGVSGTITMNRNHTLIATASKEYTLTVTKGTGVNGTPNSGNFAYKEGSPVSYSYSLQSGYQNLLVTLDGNPTAASGTITMNGNHTLVASATKQWTLTVTRGTGVAGTPVTGTYIFANGSSAAYSYSLQSGYTNLAVTLDGNPVGNSSSASGNITMTANHTLIANATAADKKKGK